MRIGVVVPMKPEFFALGHYRVRPGAIEHLSSGVLAALSGVGPERARNTARRLVDNGATALMSWGCAAALRPDVRVGALLLPTRVIATGSAAYEADAEWHRLLCERIGGVDINTGALVESALLQDRASKASLAASSGAVAADMESAAVAAIAHEAQLPFIAIRAVSDPADIGVPSSLAASVTDDGEIAKWRAFAALAAAPAHWITAVRLGLGFRAAQLTLRRVAARTGLGASADFREMFAAAKS